MLRSLLLLLACLLASSAAALEPIPIGVSGPFTGGSSSLGLSMLAGIRMAAARINAEGGLLGRPLHLVERDDEARNERGAQVAQELVNQEKVVAAVGIVNTGVALASQHIYEQARIPMITAVATGSLVTRQFLPPLYAENYIFRVSAPDSLQAEMIVEEAVDKRGFHRVGILHDATNYGQLGRNDLESALARRGLKPVAVERFKLREADMSPQLARAREAGAEVILTYGIGPELAQLANTLARMNWKVPLVGSWTLGMDSFIDNAGPNAEGARMPQTFIIDPRLQRSAGFLAAYREATGSGRIPVPPVAAQAFDATLILAAAIRQAGTTDGPGIRAALENLETPVEGVIMTYDRPFSKNDHEAIRSTRNLYLGEVRNGSVVFAYPAEHARAASR